MKTYIDYKNQLQGFKDVSETVKAVEKVTASSIHLLKQRVANLSVYVAEMEKTLTRLSLFYQKKTHPLLREGARGKRAIVVVTGEKGLLGGLWHEIVNAFFEKARLYKFVAVIGAKGESYLKEEGASIAKSFAGLTETPQEKDVERIAGYFFNEFKKGGISRVDILYPRFISLTEQRPLLLPFLPFRFTPRTDHENNSEESSPEALGLPIFEPAKDKFFDQLLQKYIGVFFYRTIAEAKLSELSARTISMEHASAKTKDVLKKLRLNYLKNRRRCMTEKQLESFAVHRVS